jgi:predicted kinase
VTSIVTMLCGPVGSGKTTRAKELEAGGAVRLSLDECMIHFYGHHMPREVFEERSKLCQEWMLTLSEQLLLRGVDVVLDWGFWDRASRDGVRSRLGRFDVRLEHLALPAEERWRWLAKRNRNLPPGTYEITADMFSMFEGWFHAPEPDEPHKRVSPAAPIDPLPKQP